MDLSIIIINWNSKGLVRACLASIYRQTYNLEFEVILIDNASHDGCGEMIDREFKNVTFIQTDRNLGFAAANNLAFRHSRGRNLLFLNPDTEVVGQAIASMLSFLDSRADAGAVGCKLFNSDRSIQTTCIQPFPTITNQVLGIESLKRLFPRLKMFGIAPLLFNPGHSVPVDAISGACIMVKREVFERVGLFTSDYFMYSEDIDLCYKIKQSGHRVYYVGGAEIIHHGGQSSKHQGVSSFSVIMMKQSLFKYLVKTRGRVYGFAYRVTIALAAASRLVLLICAWPFISLTFDGAPIANAFKKWKSVLLWAIGLEALQPALFGLPPGEWKGE